jgi:CRP/FNR family cyclic AMP-dependent transcriptional regulator
MTAAGNLSNILAGLPNWPHLFARATPRRLAAGETLFRAGEEGDGCYRLDRGVLKVNMTSPKGEERILAIIGPGSIVGELAIIDGRPRSASVIAVRDCELSFINRAAFKEYTAQHADVYKYLVDVLVSRLREADEAIAAASFLSVKAPRSTQAARACKASWPARGSRARPNSPQDQSR